MTTRRVASDLLYGFGSGLGLPPPFSFGGRMLGSHWLAVTMTLLTLGRLPPPKFTLTLGILTVALIPAFCLIRVIAPLPKTSAPP